MEGCDDALQQFKDSLYFVYFKDLPDDLIEAALREAECLPGAAFLLKMCPAVYCKWLICKAQMLLLDLVNSISIDDATGEPSVDVSAACKTPNTFLKRKEILGVECEWEELKSCVDCDTDTRTKVSNTCDEYYNKCKSVCVQLGLGIAPQCHRECYTCESGKVIRRGSW